MDYIEFLKDIAKAAPMQFDENQIAEMDVNEDIRKLRGKIDQQKTAMLIGMESGGFIDAKSDNKQDREVLIVAFVRKGKADNLDSIALCRAEGKYQMHALLGQLLYKRQQFELHHFEITETNYRYVYNYPVADYHGLELTLTLGHSVNSQLYYQP